jgi:Rap1a immunity proteins
MSSGITASLFGAALAFAVTAAGVAEDNKDILPGCKERDLSYCMGQINGIAHMLNISKKHSLPYECADLPQGITNRELAEALIRYNKAYPNRQPMSFAEDVISALMLSWPCRK